MQNYNTITEKPNQVNEYIPYDMSISEMEDAFYRDLTTEKRNRELTRIGNRFKSISEQLQESIDRLNGKTESEVKGA